MGRLCVRYAGNIHHKVEGRIEPLEEDNEVMNPTLKSVGIKPTPEEVESHNAYTHAIP